METRYTVKCRNPVHLSIVNFQAPNLRSKLAEDVFLPNSRNFKWGEGHRGMGNRCLLPYFCPHVGCSGCLFLLRSPLHNDAIWRNLPELWNLELERLLKLLSYSTGLTSWDECHDFFVAAQHSLFLVYFSGILGSIRRSVFTSLIMARFRFDSSGAKVLFQGNLANMICNRSFNAHIKVYSICCTWMVSLFKKQTHVMEGRYLGKQRDMWYQEVGEARVTDFLRRKWKTGSKATNG